MKRAGQRIQRCPALGVPINGQLDQSFFILQLVSVDREFGIAKNTHFWSVESTKFFSFGDAQWNDQVAELEPNHRHHETEDEHDGGIE